MKRYKVTHQNQELPAQTLPEIVAKVRAREIEMFDYIYDEAAQDWVLLMEFPELAQMLKSTKPPKPPTFDDEITAKTLVVDEPQPEPTVRVSSRSEHDVTDWYILKGEHRFGPFAYNDVIKMLQQKIVFPFDWIWHAGLNGWHRVTELAEFQAAAIRELAEKKGKKKEEVFLNRKFNRMSVKARVFVHDNITLWKGTSFEISQGGIGVTLDNHLIQPGQTVTLHVKPSGEIPAFNAVCEVVSKKFQPDRNEPIDYGFKFMSLSAEAQEELKKRVS